MKHFYIAAFGLVGFGLHLFAHSAIEQATPPIAKKVPHKTEIHGRTLVDNYRWLQEKTHPDVRTYLEAENTYTDAVMRPTLPLQKTLYDEMLSRLKETDVDVPYKMGNYFYYTRTEAGKQYKIYCRKKGALQSPEEIILDLNELAKDKAFISLSEFEISPNGRFLAYTYDDLGFRQYKLAVKDLFNKKHLIDRADRVGSVVWANDNKTLFYSQEDEVSKRQYQVFRHELNTSKKDELIFEEKDERFSVYAYRSADDSKLFFLSESLTSTEGRFLDADRPFEKLAILEARKDKIRYYPDHADSFYLRTDDKGENFRLVKSSKLSPPFVWREVIPYSKDVMLRRVIFFKDFHVVYSRANGLPRLAISDTSHTHSTPISFSEPSYYASPQINREYQTLEFRYSYESPITPPSIFSFSTKNKTSTLLKQKEVPNYIPSKYEVKRLFATAPDKTQIPITLVQLKDKKPGNKNPLYLNGYGSYGYSFDTGFDAEDFSLIDRGVTVAFAHIRGGGEMGMAWHEDGRMMKKKNSFTDFIACAEHLISSGYGSKSRLVIQGGSAGGLLMGAVVNMRPDLFKAVILRVPFVDVINTMLDESLPLTVGEFEEWGNPKEKPAFEYMLSYSPYDNITAKSYPDLLLTTSLHDSQVMYWEPAKYTAKMRATKTGGSLVLLKTNLEPSGHGGTSGRYDRFKETAFNFAFILKEMGITK